MLDGNRDLCQSPHRFSAGAVSIGHEGGRAFGTKDQKALGLGRLWGGRRGARWVGPNCHQPARGEVQSLMQARSLLNTATVADVLV